MKSNLKKLRKEAGLTMQELADKVGIVQSQISKLEGDSPNPTMRTALKLSEVLDVALHHLFEND